MRKRERKRERKHVCVLISVCVLERWRERERRKSAFREKYSQQLFIVIKTKPLSCQRKVFQFAICKFSNKLVNLDLLSFQVGKTNSTDIVNLLFLQKKIVSIKYVGELK